MKRRNPFIHTSAVWALVAVLFAANAAPSLGGLECGATQWTRDSYRAAEHVLAAARTWSRIARLWIDPMDASPAPETANRG